MHLVSLSKVDYQAINVSTIENKMLYRSHRLIEKHCIVTLPPGKKLMTTGFKSDFLFNNNKNTSMHHVDVWKK